jgi:hypothetical protein
MDEGIEIDEQLIHKELTEAIIGAAMTLLNTLRPRLDEKLYERPGMGGRFALIFSSNIREIRSIGGSLSC